MRAMVGRTARWGALLIATWTIGGCAPIAPGPSATAGPSGPVQPSRPPVVEPGLRAEDVPQIGSAPGPDVEGQTSPGALAVLIESRAGRVIHGVGATCSWSYGEGDPTLVSVVGGPVEVYGERLRPAVHEGQPMLEREWAPYVVLADSTLDEPRLDGDLTFVRATRLRASTFAPAPDGVSIDAWRRPLGGDAAALIVQTLEIAWRCGPPPPQATAPPEPEPDPTPVCPPPVSVEPPPFPRTTLSAAGQTADGEPASVTLVSCTLTGADQGPWIVPATGIAIAAGTPLVFRVEAPGVELVRVATASAGRAEVGAGPSLELEVRGDSRTGAVLVEPPPPGDWSVSVSVVLNDRVHGAVWSAPVYFRVRVAG
jgi:hypothetical protein